MDKVWKFFGKGEKRIVVLKDININIEEGEFVIVGGRNGAGKSTLLKLMIGLLIPDKGRVTVFGLDTVKKWKEISTKIGVVLAGDRGIYWKLTGKENLEIFGGLYGVPKKELKNRCEYLLSVMGLDDFADERVENYSTGMRRKLMLAKALMHDPQILFLDEMLNGIDPKSYKDILDILLKINKEGKTVVLVTHTFHELPSNIRVIFLKEGRISYMGEMKDLLIKTKVKVTAIIGDEEVKYETNDKSLPDVVNELIAKKAKDIKIERETIYDVTRRHI